ncbi:hypothetical protein AMECASPLE_009630 [Ameca splendens]|uniref:Uncharacterized protein n=1 Tax=Ameca splendens TaxID=208324 RepID=A0ABV0Y0P8_9TELE
MHTHVGTGPRSEKQKKSFKGLKVAESTEKMSWKAEEHVRDSPLLSALSSLSMMSTEQPQLVLARPLPTSPSQASPLTSAPASCFKDLSEQHVTQSEATRGKTAMEHLNLVSKQDVYVPMDPISGRACSHVDPQAEKQETTEASQKVDANGRSGHAQCLSACLRRLRSPLRESDSAGKHEPGPGWWLCVSPVQGEGDPGKDSYYPLRHCGPQGEPSLEWLAYQKYFKDLFNRPQRNPEQHLKLCSPNLPQGQSS